MYLEMDAVDIPTHLAEFFEPIPAPKAKSLSLIPQRFAIAMQDRGWIVRSQIVWAKTSAMPESVRDRPTSAWEPIWMFAKSARYFWDAEAVRTAAVRPGDIQTFGGAKGRAYDPQPGDPNYRNGHHQAGRTIECGAGANLRNVWTLGPEPQVGVNHYASFPTAIPRLCIKAATSERGQCPACGAPWVRLTGRGALVGRRARPGQPAHLSPQGYLRAGGSRCGDIEGGTTTLGWAPSCQCKDAGVPVPQTVLDPFAGTGTTGLVADRLGRHAILIELNPEYAEMARRRIATDAGFLDETTVVPPPPLDRQPDIFEVAG